MIKRSVAPCSTKEVASSLPKRAVIQTKDLTQMPHEILDPKQMSSEVLGECVRQQMTVLLVRLADLRPYVEELWARFDNGEVIMGCRTRKEFCQQVLHRDPRTVRYMLDGGKHKREAEKVSAPVSTPAAASDPVFAPEESSTSINRHLVNARVGDRLVFYGSGGNKVAPIVDIDDTSVTVAVGKKKRLETYHLTDRFIRQNLDKAEREPEYLHHTHRAGHCVACRKAGLPENGTCGAPAPAPSIVTGDAVESATKFIDSLVQRMSAADRAIVYRSLVMKLEDRLNQDEAADKAYAEWLRMQPDPDHPAMPWEATLTKEELIAYGIPFK